jgi:wyosine [tRNA(Phe)-imidazoG37] synthetase (radical SAM superfamily)
MISFGPVPSRRLGKSLGINNITSGKKCTYSCIYCQLGKTKFLTDKRVEFYEPDYLFNEVCKHLKKLKKEDKPEFLTFVSNGEPTLDVNLGISIEKLKALDIPIAVITNASLLKYRDVIDDLKKADWVSLKIDAADEKNWKLVNRPISTIRFQDYIKGLLNFSREFKGKLVTETMLVKDLNDNPDIIEQIAALIARINPYTAYISIPIRPPAIKTVSIPESYNLNEAYQIFLENRIHTELISGFEGTNTGYTGNIIEDIINICTVHPIREDTMEELLKKDKAEPEIVESLLRKNLIQKITYKDKIFYLRKFHI